MFVRNLRVHFSPFDSSPTPGNPLKLQKFAKKSRKCLVESLLN